MTYVMTGTRSRTDFYTDLITYLLPPVKTHVKAKEYEGHENGKLPSGP